MLIKCSPPEKKIQVLIVRYDIRFTHMENLYRGQFHQRFTSNFYEHRSQKRKKTLIDDLTVFLRFWYLQP